MTEPSPQPHSLPYPQKTFECNYRFGELGRSKKCNHPDHIYIYCKKNILKGLCWKEVPLPMTEPSSQPHSLRCVTCKNKTCKYYSGNRADIWNLTSEVGCVSHSDFTSTEKVLDEVSSLIEKGIETCPNCSHCLHVLFLAGTPEGREELRQEKKEPMTPSPQPHPQECPHWRCTDNLKSDFRDQNLPRYYCDKEHSDSAEKVPVRLLDALEIIAKTESWIAMNTFIAELRQQEKMEES